MQNNPITNKYRTIVCRHHDTKHGCQMGDKCKFAHGSDELRNMDDPLPLQKTQKPVDQYMQGMYGMIGMANYKSMKCFYFERDKYCKHGNACQYAHSDNELKTQNDISYLSSIANTINCQLTSGYEGYDSQTQQTQDQNMINEQAYYMNEMMRNNMMIQQANNNNYDNYSYTPDTNYGTTSTNQVDNSNTTSNYSQGYEQGYYDPNYPQYYYDPNTGMYNYANYGNDFQNTNNQGEMNLPQSNIVREQIEQTNPPEEKKIEKKKITIELENK